MSEYTAVPLTDPERDAALAAIERDGFVVLPRRLDPATCAAAIAAVQAQAEGHAGAFRCDDLLPRAAVFRSIASTPAVLQVLLDVLGPTLQLVQSNAFLRPHVSAVADRDYLAATPWHADGPVGAHHPRIHGVPALISVKLGVFLTDVGAESDGPLQVVRGSHRIAPGTVDHEIPPALLARHAAAITSVLVPAGSLVLFHIATWHAAPPVTSGRARVNLYFNYGPPWLRPWDRPAECNVPAEWPAVAQVLQRGASTPRATQFPGSAELDPFASWRRTAVRWPGMYA